MVDSTQDTGYAAKDTLAGTRLRTQLKDVGAAISVVTQKFLQDTNSKSAEDLLVYTTGTEVAGQGGNFLGQGDGSVLTGTNRQSPIQNTRVRGLAEADNTRDFFLSDIPWDSYNVGRVDLQRGANSILFGIGSPAGIVNSSLNTAAFKDSNKVEFQFATFGTKRATADFNKVLLKNELAVRLALLYNEIEYRQDPAFKDDHRVFAALKWDPKFLAKTGSRTSFRANFEKGEIRSNNPRGTPPLDAISQWFALGKPTLDQRTSTDSTSGSPNNNWFGAPGGRVFDGVVTAFSGNTQGISYASQVPAYPNAGGGTAGSGVGNNTLRGIRTYDAYGNAQFPAGAIGAYKAKSLTDPNIFNFYENLLEGPNKREFNDFEAFNLALSQTFLNDKVGFELAYDRQKAKWGYANFLSGDGAVITVDIMSTLANGAANPNVGRPMTISGGGSAGQFWQEREREAKRATVFGELNFGDVMGRENSLGKILGRHVFTGLYNTQKNDNESRSGPRFFLSDQYLGVKGGVANPDSLGQASRDDIFYNYLGGSLSGASSASGIGLTGVKDIVTPRNSTIPIWNNTTNQWETIPLLITDNNLPSDESKQYTQGVRSRSTVDSSAFVWQGYLFGGNVVPMVGWRKDTDTFQSAGSPLTLRGVAQVMDPNWRLPVSAGDVNYKSGGQDLTRNYNEISGSSRTWSIVAHAPRRLMDKLPGKLGVSVFYNESENFQPDAGRRDIFGAPVASPSGETKDYGFAISALDEKITLRVNRYETTVTNANVAGEIGGQYLIGAVEGWGQQAAEKFRTSITPTGATNWPADTVFGISSSGNKVTWRPAGPVKGSSGAYTYTQAELDATYTREKASIDAWYATQVPAAFQNMWGLTNYATGGGSINFAPSGLTVTGDTVSKGTEFELIARPVKGLDISMNASKTSAKRLNLAKSYTDWILKRQSQFAGAAGEMRLWGSEDDFSNDSTHGGETARGKFARETIAGYNLWQALLNSDVPELRPWRFNVVGNYSFQSEGILRGVNVGAGYRWQDKNVTGFPVVVRNGVQSYDVTRPYKGPNEGVTDLWIGYERKLTQRIKWRAQLNVRDLFSTDKLIRVTVQPDGSPGAYRIPEPRIITLTNSFIF
ncbi:MAG TPA: TonB-dependent receptor plug domain-containing protein [Opitutaceae bacterium]|nr:TonB-dependent receptor plug domain-containing protein [Opitutaceae bacterium]